MFDPPAVNREEKVEIMPCETARNKLYVVTVG